MEVVEEDIITISRVAILEQCRADYYADLRDLDRGSIAFRGKQYQQKYPGNYKIEEYFERARHHHRWNVRLRFETPKDKTMFLLRYA